MKRIWYLGVVPKTGYREYGFNVEDEDKSLRQVVLTIDNLLFVSNRLNFQEAPDLCYQKLKTDLIGEEGGNLISSRVPVTASDLDSYRGLHQNQHTRARHK